QSVKAAVRLLPASLQASSSNIKQKRSRAIGFFLYAELSAVIRNDRSDRKGAFSRKNCVILSRRRRISERLIADPFRDPSSFHSSG
ncbi:MAG: hypothetical protein IKW76_05010, partial [Clostridia bacterium]|nr:hypothetical protein [Clostridia bacterium]